MTINDALKDGKNHIICNDGTEFDVKPSTDGGYIIHHIEKRGKPVAKNRLKMEQRDSETWIKRKHGGIKDIGIGKYEQYIPDPDFDVKYGDLRKEEDTGNYEFEEEPEEEITFDEPENPDELLDEMPDLSTPSEEYKEEEIKEETKEEDFEPVFEEEQEMNIPSQIHEQAMTQMQPVANSAQNRSSIIYEDMCMNGNIDTQGSVEVYGSICGNIKAAGSVMIQGYVEGDIMAGDIFLTGDHGEIVGSSVSGNRMQIDAGCVVIGNVRAGDLVVEGAIKGDVDVAGRVYVKSTAIIMGDIISKSVIIEEGAAIEGMCVQKYSENNPTDFFDRYVVRLTGEPLNPDKYKETAPVKENNDAFGNNVSYSQMMSR